MNNIQAQIDYYKQNSSAINSAHTGNVILIGSDMSISDFKTPSEAYVAGVGAFGYGNFLMKDLTTGNGKVVNMINPSITTSV